MRFEKHVAGKNSMWSSWADRAPVAVALLATLFLTTARGVAQQVPPPHDRFGEFPRFANTADEFGEGRNPWQQRRVKPFRVIGNLYYVGFQDVSAWFIATPQGHIQIDSTWEQTWPLIMESIEELGFQVRDIKYLLSSHSHIAHIAAHRTAKDLTGAQIWASRRDAANWIEKPEAVEAKYATDFYRLRWKPAKVDKYVETGTTLTLGGTTLTAHITACETEGATTWTMVAEEGGRRYNVVMSSGLGVGNLKSWPTKARDCEEGLKRAAALPADVYLSVHDPYWGFREKRAKMNSFFPGNPFLNGDEYRAYVAARQKDLQDALAGRPVRGGAD